MGITGCTPGLCFVPVPAEGFMPPYPSGRSESAEADGDLRVGGLEARSPNLASALSRLLPAFRVWTRCPEPLSPQEMQSLEDASALCMPRLYPRHPSPMLDVCRGDRGATAARTARTIVSGRLNGVICRSKCDAALTGTTVLVLAAYLVWEFT